MSNESHGFVLCSRFSMHYVLGLCGKRMFVNELLTLKIIFTRKNVHVQNKFIRMIRLTLCERVCSIVI